MKYLILDNGLGVLFHSMPNTHSITLGLYVRAGQAYNDENHIGITHLLEHMHFRRLGKMSQDELYYKMESIGSSLRAVTYRDFLKFTMKITPDRLAGAIEIFQNLFKADEWTDDEFMKEKQVVMNQIKSKGNYLSLEQETRKVIFRDHSLLHDIMGSIEDVELIDKEDLREYKNKIFNSLNILFCITGNVSDSDCQNMINKLQLSTISRTVEKKKIDCPKYFHRRRPDIGFVSVQDENFLEVNISFDITYNKESKDLLTILNCILGEGVGSRLQKNIREEKGYTSDIASYIEWYQDFAVLHVNFSVEKQNFLVCFEEIIKIIKQLQENITKRDLDVSLPFYTTNQIFYEDDTEEMNFQLAYNRLVLNMNYQVPNLQNNGSTILKLQGLAKEIFVKKNICVVVVGNTRGITKKSLVQIIDNL